ncbi:ABC transporter permease [Corynebacterium glucuronolyticum]|uniref:ABC transporter permease n=1 Tax=Corynebacterium glucuronolyticum TaxID=39791 RepID=UPI0021B04E2D|nr:ABC transporter permease [Corynebacterium glucuronolyticum]MCT1443373.1 ABC transporter permease [Corynebacterium glucuronolyticum]
MNTESTEIVVTGIDQLKSLNRRLGLSEYVAETFKRVRFIWVEARFRAFRTTRDYRYWKFWLLIQPLLDVAVYGLVFGVILKTNRGIDNYVGYLVIGVTFFGFMSSMASAGQGLVKANRAFMRTFEFPRVCIILSHACRYALDHLPAALMSLIFAVATSWGQLDILEIWKLVLVVPIYFLIHIFGAGLMLLIARLSAQIPDVKALIGVALRVWFFISGVFFSISSHVDHAVLRRILEANPAVQFLNALRDIVLRGDLPSFGSWLALLLWSTGIFALGFICFWQAEEKYVNV